MNRYGERWCSYSRRYEKADQNTYGCRGFANGSSSGSSGCFITTACVEHRGLQDNCHELTVMRSVRDTWLLHQPFGKEQIEEYYRIAPEIVRTINRRDDCDKIWEELYRDYILPCVHEAEMGMNEKAYVIYCRMVEKCKEM